MSIESSSRVGGSVGSSGAFGSGPVDLKSGSVARHPLPFLATRLSGGLLGTLQTANATTSIRRGDSHLEGEHVWENFANAAAGRIGGRYYGPVFEDGEVYKWLEAVAWEAGRSGDVELAAWLDVYTPRIAAAQADDGYLNTFFTASGQRTERYQDLGWDHEIFNMGAMIQSGVAQFRATGKTGLLTVAIKAADHLDRTFGPGKREGTCGHPVAEMALVELFRATGERRYLELAKYFVDVRGHEILKDGLGRFGVSYYSDRVPVRETQTPEGHAVRAMYLAAGATDVAIETGDDELLGALEKQWETMLASKTYLTGGLGSRWEGESFGDPYELPSDRAYAETCAAIASMQWSWRLYLATGRAKYVDFVERQLYNAMLPGIALDGDAYFYVNALQVRSGAQVDDPGQRNPAHGRQHWFGTSCCPTNIMRTLASLHQYVASSTDEGVRIDQFTSSEIDLDLKVGHVALSISTNYPWSGDVTVSVSQTPDDPWDLGLRIPAWASGASVTIGDETFTPEAGTYFTTERMWVGGDEVVLRLPLEARLTRGNIRIDDVRGSVAIERGPLVFAIEHVDQPDGVIVDDVTMIDQTLTETYDADLFGGIPVVTFSGASPGHTSSGYLPATSPAETPNSPATITAIPYFMWANREVGPMRVWIPAAV